AAAGSSSVGPSEGPGVILVDRLQHLPVGVAQIRPLLLAYLVLIEAALEHLLLIQLVQRLLFVHPAQHPIADTAVLDPQYLHGAALGGLVQTLAQVADDLLALIDDLQPGVRADSNQLGQPRGNRRPVPGVACRALEYGYLQQPGAGLALALVHDESRQGQALAPARLAEAHGQRRAAVTDVFRVVDLLWYVQMTEGDIVEARREQA